MISAAALLLAGVVFASPAYAAGQASRLHGRVFDTSRLPLPGVTLTLRAVPPEAGSPIVAVTNGTGDYEFLAPAGRYTLVAELSGFQQVTREVALGADAVQVDLELPLAAFTQETQVVAQVPRLLSSSEPTAPSTVDKDVIKIAPVQNLRYDSALPLLPGAVRGPDGLISVSGARGTQGSVQLDGFRENDPVSGEPAINLPIAAIDSVQVFAPGPPADSGPGTSGMTLVNSRRGADAYGLTLSTFVPRPRFGGGPAVINGIESWQPNLGISGPIVRGRAWFLQGAEYRWERFLNETTAGLQDSKLTSLTSFTRVDVGVTKRFVVATRLAIDPEDRQHFGLDAFAPSTTVPNLSSRPLSTAIATRLSVRDDAIEMRFHLKRRRLRLFPVSEAVYSIGHDRVRGSYYRTTDRVADRLEGSAAWTHPRANWGGDHLLRAGLAVGWSTVTGTASSRPVNYLRSDGTPARRIEFLSGGILDAAAGDLGVFVQDAWTVRKGLKADLGMRLDYSGAFADRAAWPRGAVSYEIDSRTRLTGGAGIYAAKPTLNAAIFDQRQPRRVTTFAAGGALPLPQVLTNAVAGPMRLAHARTAFVQIDRTILHAWTLRAVFHERRGYDELVVDPQPAADGAGRLALTASGRSRARSLEATAGYRSATATRQFYLSYVRASSRGNLNDLNTVTGTLATALVLPDAYAPLAADVPHRFLAWGIISLPWHLTLAPFLELRSGFPFSPIDDDWNPAGPRNGARYPMFASADVAIEKAMKLPIGPPLRIGLKFFNVTGRNNGRNIQPDIARPDFGHTFNPIRRQFRASLELVWSKS